MSVKNKKILSLSKISQLIQTAVFGAGMLSNIKTALPNTRKKVGEKVDQKISSSLGLNFEKTDPYGLSLRKVYLEGKLSNEEKEKIKAWLGELRIKDEKLADEFTNCIHNAVNSVRKKVIEAGTKGKPQEQIVTDDSYGIRIAEDIIRDILKALDDNLTSDNLTILNKENIRVVPPKEPYKITKALFTKLAEAEKENCRDFNETMAKLKERSKAWRKGK